jgi:hypothetical protein
MDIDSSEAIEGLRSDMHRMRDDIRHHFDIVAESLRDDLRVIAEGVIALDAKVARLRPPDDRV